MSHRSEDASNTHSDDDVDAVASTRRTTIKALGVLGTTAVGLSRADSAAAYDGDGHTISIVSQDDETVYYEFSVDGTIEKADTDQATINDYDTVEEASVVGRTTHERDAYEFEGLITEFSTTAPAEVYVDGVRIDSATSSEGVDQDADIDTDETNAEAETEAEAEQEDEQEDEPEDEDDEDEDDTDDSEERVDESEFDEVVDIVEAGADNTGSSRIDSTLSSAAGDGVLVRFPPGEYRLAGELRLTNEGRVGFIGTDDTTIIHDGGGRTLFKLGTYRDANEHVHVENFTVDISASNTGGRAFESHATETLYVGDLTIEGKHDTSRKGPLSVGLQASGGEGVVENYSAPDGGEDVSGGNGGTGLLVSNYHEGVVEIYDAHIGPFPDNGIYCSNGTPPSHQGGTVHVYGGLVENTNVAGVRLAGDGSTIDGTEFVYDESIPGFDGQRPIRLDWGSGLEVTNVDISMDNVTITEAIRVLDGVDSASISDVTGDLSSSVRDAVSVVSGAGDIDTSGIDITGQSRNELFNY